jgi:hypothetical protein
MSRRDPDREGCQSIHAIHHLPPLADDRHSLGQAAKAATCNRRPHKGAHRFAVRLLSRRKSGKTAAVLTTFLSTTLTAAKLVAGKAALGSIVCRLEECLLFPCRGAQNQIEMRPNPWRALHRRPRAIAAGHLTRRAPTGRSSVLCRAWITTTHLITTCRRPRFPVLIVVGPFLVPATHA